MKTEVKVFIALIVMLLSTGPLMYFFGADGTQQINYNENETGQSLVSTISANATATVASMRPYVSFVGISDTNNATFLNALMDYVNYTSNYTTKVTLNPAGAGYRYNMIVYLKNDSDLLQLGYKLNVLTQPYFSEYYVTTSGTVLLDSSFVSGNRTLYASNVTVPTVFLYSDRLDSKVNLICDLTVIASGNVTASQTCVSLSTGYKHGLSMTDYFTNSDTVEKTMNLTVFMIDSTGVLGNYSNLMLNATDIASKLNISSDFVYVSNPVNGTGEGSVLIRIQGDSKAKAEEAVTLLKSMKVNVTETYKVGAAMPPTAVVIDGEKKIVGMNSALPIKLSLDGVTGVKSVDLLFTMVFGEVSDITENLA